MFIYSQQISNTNNNPIQIPQFGQNNKNYSANHRIRNYNRDISQADKAKALIGSTVGTALSLSYMLKNKKLKTH